MPSPPLPPSLAPCASTASLLVVAHPGVQFNRHFCRPRPLESGPERPEPRPSHVWGFETYLKLRCPSTECGPELGPVTHPVLGPKLKMSIELHPRDPPEEEGRHTEAHPGEGMYCQVGVL